MFLRSELPRAAFCRTSYVDSRPCLLFDRGILVSLSRVDVNSGMLEEKSIVTSLVGRGLGSLGA
jgi:hypothetical protein